jgi:hypothetical protein
MLYMFHIYITSISSGCCIYFTRTLQAFYLDITLHMFAMATHVFLQCFIRMLQVFQLFWTYVASVSSIYCKSRSGVTHVVVRPIYHSRILQLLGLPACVWVWRGASGKRGKRCMHRSRRGPLWARVGMGNGAPERHGAPHEVGATACLCAAAGRRGLVRTFGR